MGICIQSWKLPGRIRNKLVSVQNVFCLVWLPFFLRTGRSSRGGCLPPLRSSAVYILSPQNFLRIFVHVFESHSRVCIGNHFKKFFLRLVRWSKYNDRCILQQCVNRFAHFHFSLNVESEQFVTRRNQDRWDDLNWSRAVQVVAQSAALKNLKYKLSSNIFYIGWSFYWWSRGFYWHSEPDCLPWTPGNHCLWWRFPSEGQTLLGCQIW